MSYETVELNVTKLSENKYRDGNKVYIVANLIERAKEFEPFDLPLIALNASSNVWHPVSCAYDLARKMKRVPQADLNCPIILDESGFVMDGWHRIAKALFEGRETIKAVRFKETPPCDYVETE